MIVLSAADVVEVAEIQLTTLKRWTKTGHVKPMVQGIRTGHFSKWSVTQTLGVAIADHLRQTTRGCRSAYAGELVEAFGKLTEVQLQNMLDEDGHGFVMLHQGKPLFQDCSYGRIDVAKLYQKVCRNIQRVQKRLAKQPVHGQVRGLALACE